MLSNKKYFDDQLKRDILLSSNPTVQSYLKVTVGNDVFNLKNYDRKLIIDATIIKPPNSTIYRLQDWNEDCNDKIGAAKIQIFEKQTHQQVIWDLQAYL